MSDNISYNITATIDEIDIRENRADGTPYIDKRGSPFVVAIITMGKDVIDDPDFFGRVSFADFNDVTKNWEAGISITGMITKKLVESQEGTKTYWNFKIPSKFDLLVQQVEAMDKRLSAVEEVVSLKDGKEPF